MLKSANATILEIFANRAAKSQDAKVFYEESLDFEYIVHDGSKLFAGELEVLLMRAREAGADMDLILNRTKVMMEPIYHIGPYECNKMSILGKVAATCQYWKLKVLLEQGADGNLIVCGLHALHWLCNEEGIITCDDSTSALECVCRFVSEKNINRAFPVFGTSVLDILMDKRELVTEATKKTFEANIEVLLQHGAKRYVFCETELCGCDSDASMSSLNDEWESPGNNNGREVELPPLLPATPPRGPKIRSTSGNGSPVVDGSHVHQWQIPHTSYVECVHCRMEGYDENIGTL